MESPSRSCYIVCPQCVLGVKLERSSICMVYIRAGIVLWGMRLFLGLATKGGGGGAGIAVILLICTIIQAI